MDSKKGQYFSFDAVVATLIMVLAFTSLVGYWFGAQSVIDERSNSMYADSLRVADSLLSPGVPSDWQTLSSLSGVAQLGLTSGFSSELDKKKLEVLNLLVGVDQQSTTEFEKNYLKLKKLLRTGGEVYIVINQTDDASSPMSYQFGRSFYAAGANPAEVAVAHRGASLNGTSGYRPMSVKVYIWRNETG